MTPEREEQLFAELKQIKTALVGDEQFGVDGLVQRFEAHEEVDRIVHADVRKIQSEQSALKTEIGTSVKWIVGIIGGVITVINALIAILK